MIPILENFLAKLGLKGYEDLSLKEKITWDRWQKQLGATVKPEDLKKFLVNELERYRELREIEASVPGDRVDIERLAYIRTLKGLLGQYARADNEKATAEAEIKSTLNVINNKPV